MTETARLSKVGFSESSLLGPQGRVFLKGNRAVSYVRILLSLLEAGRLNRFFPDRKGISALYRFLSPPANHYLYDSFEVGLRTGLPTEKAVSRIQTDRAIARQVRQRMEREKPSLRGTSITPSQPGDPILDRNYRYHRALLERPFISSFSLDLDLRRVEPAQRTACFRTTLDRFDLSSERFVRYTILLRHRAARWARDQIRLKGDDLEFTRNFRNRLSRTMARDSEIAFLLLSDTPGITVESVTRARIGPLFFHGTEAPENIRPILEEHPADFILSLPVDRTDVKISGDSDGDPIGRSYRDFLAPEARELVEFMRERLGYCVRRERKFVCTPGVADSLRAALKEMRKPCVIYMAPLGE